MSDPRCSFYVRFPVDDGHRYEHVTLSVWDGSTYQSTPTPPVPGDLINLRGVTDETRGMFRVVAREWLYPSFGSADWPYTESEPLKGPIVTVVVEVAPGLFADEVETDPEK